MSEDATDGTATDGPATDEATTDDAATEGAGERPVNTPEEPGATDSADGESVLPVTRRDVVRSVGAAGVLGPMAGLNVGEVGSTGEDTERWVLQYFDEHHSENDSRYPTPTDGSDPPGDHRKVALSMNYQDVEWVSGGSPVPTDDEYAGCWRHTFVVDATAIAVQHIAEENVEDDDEPDVPPHADVPHGFPDFDSTVRPLHAIDGTEFTISTNWVDDDTAPPDADSQAVAVSTRRDSDLFSLSWLPDERLDETLTVETEDGSMREMELIEYLGSYAGGDLQPADVEWIDYGRVTHDRIDEEDYADLTTALGVLSLPVGFVYPPAGIAIGAVSLLIEWLDDAEYDPEVRYNDGFHIEHTPPVDTAFASAWCVFDVYVAPGHQGTVTLETDFQFENGWGTDLEGFQTNPRFELSIEGPSVDELDRPEPGIFTADVLFQGDEVEMSSEDVDDVSRETHTNVGQDGDPGSKAAVVTSDVNNDPSAAFYTYRDNAPTGEGITLQSYSVDYDGEIVHHEWEVRKLAPGATTQWESIDGADGEQAVVSRDVRGRYEVRLTVHDDGFATDSTTTEVTFGEPHDVTLTAEPTVARRQDTVQFTTETDATSPRYRFRFYRFDPVERLHLIEETEFRESGSYERSFAAAGAYKAEVIVEDYAGVRSVDAVSVDSVGLASDGVSLPDAAFDVVGGTPVPAEQWVTFDASPSEDPDGTIENYYWFGTHETRGETADAWYPTRGRKHVWLVVEDDQGNVAGTLESFDAAGLRAAFDVVTDGDDVQGGDVVTFDASPSRYVGDEAVTDYGWSGDVSGSGRRLTTSLDSPGEVVEVTLTVTGSDGATDEATEYVYVHENRGIVADISPAAITRAPGDSIAFDATDSFDADVGGIGEFEWRVDDGDWQTGSERFETTFSDAGDHAVAVRVTDHEGDVATAEASVTVAADGPVPAFETYRCDATGPDEACTDRTDANEFTSAGSADERQRGLWLDASASRAAGGGDLTYYWEGLDTETSDELAARTAADGHPPVVRIARDAIDDETRTSRDGYGDAGSHPIRLRVVDGEGREATVTRPVRIVPHVSLDVDAEAVVGEETTVRVSWDGVGGEYSADRFEVVRVEPEPALEPPTVEEADFFHDRTVTFRETGTYELALTVLDATSEVHAETTATVEVVDPREAGEPAAVLSADRTSVTPGETVTLDASASQGGTGETTYAWSVHNASTGDPVSIEADGQQAEVTLQQFGVHEFAVAVTDVQGAGDVATAEVVVAREPADGGPVARIDVDPNAALVDQPVWLDGRRSYAAAGIDDYEWVIEKFPDVGLGDQPADPVFGTGEIRTGPRARTSFQYADSFRARLTVTDANGETASAVRTVDVHSGPDNAGDVSLSPSIPHVGDEVTLDASGAASEDGIDAYEWLVDGSTVGSGPIQTTTFEETGTHAVTLRLRDVDGEGGVETENEVTEEVSVAPAEPPTAAINLSTTELQPGGTLTMDGSGSTDDHAIDEYSWSIAETGSSTASLPFSPTGEIVTVSSWPDVSGTFEVALTVTDVTGRTATATATVEVTGGGGSPTAAVSGPTSATADETVSFDARRSTVPDGRQVDAYQWTVVRDGATVATGTGPTFDHAFRTDGDYDVRVTVTDDAGATATAETTVSVSLPAVEGGAPPGDLDDDGIHEDLNANDRFESDDVVTYFEHFSSDAIRDNVPAYDLNENERIEFDDIVVLFEEL